MKRTALVLFILIGFFSCKRDLPTTAEYENFIIAVKNSDYNTVERYIRRYDEILNIELDILGVETSMLIAAMGFDDEEMVDLFLESNIDLEYQTPEGVSALNAAIEAGSIRYTEKLLEAGSNVASVDNEGFGIYHYALNNPSLELLNGLYSFSEKIDVKNNNGFTPLMLIMLDTRRHVLDPYIIWFLENGASFQNVIEYNSDVVLVYIEDQRNDVMKYLIDNEDVILNYHDRDGNTISHFSAGTGNDEILNYLIKNDLFSNEVNDLGVTPLDMSIEWGFPSIEERIKLVLETY